MRSTTKLMKNWQFTGPDGKTTAVDLPHTWNNIDGQDGGNDYWRGTCIYKTRFAAPAFDKNTQQVWLQFEGVNASAKVTLNGVEVARHDGGYSTFRAEITPLLRESNELTVYADNSVNDRVYPQKADFTFYGGIYRAVRLLVVSKVHFALDCLGALDPDQLQGEADVVQGAALHEQVEALEDHADGLAGLAQVLVLQLGDLLAVYDHRAGGGPLQQVHAPDQGGLARPGQADDAENFPGANVQVDVLQGVDRCGAFPEGFVQMLDLDDGFAHAALSPYLSYGFLMKRFH